MSLEQINKDLENQEKWKNEKEVRDNLASFGKNPEEDKKFLEDPKGGEKAVSAIKGDIEEKTKSISPKAKEEINEKIKGLEKYSKLGKLSQGQAQELSDIYKEISSIQGTDIKKDNIQGEQVKDGREKQEQEYSKKLLDAVEKLDKLLANHNQEAQKKVQESISKSKEAQKQGEQVQQQEMASVEKFDFPLQEGPKS